MGPAEAVGREGVAFAYGALGVGRDNEIAVFRVRCADKIPRLITVVVNWLSADGAVVCRGCECVTFRVHDVVLRSYFVEEGRTVERVDFVEVFTFNNVPIGVAATRPTHVGYDGCSVPSAVEADGLVADLVEHGVVRGAHVPVAVGRGAGSVVLPEVEFDGFGAGVDGSALFDVGRLDVVPRSQVTDIVAVGFAGRDELPVAARGRIYGTNAQ